VAPPRPPVKGGATAGIGRRAYSPNPRFGSRLAAVGFGGAVAHRGVCWSVRGCPPCRVERWEPVGWHGETVARRVISDDRDGPGMCMSLFRGWCSA
jgi:hypothetical protein